MKVVRATVCLIAVCALAIPPLARSQCASLSASFAFEANTFFPDPDLIDYEIESELFLDSSLAAISEVNINFSSSVPSGGAVVTVEYFTSDIQGVSFGYNDEAAGCATPSDMICDLGILNVVRDTGSNSRMLNPSLALAALALYTQDMPVLATAGILLAPRLVAAKTCNERLVITLTLSEIDDTVGVTPTILTDSIQFVAQCTTGLACLNNILSGCTVCV